MSRHWNTVATTLALLGGLAWSGSLCVAPSAVPTAAAAVPVSGPVFTSPLDVDNAFFPVSPGGIKVYTGREGRKDIAIVEFHMVETRAFTWNQQTVECRMVRESAFVDGELFETSFHHYAQADDGGVYFFGDLSVVSDPEEPPSTSWVVGAVQPEDPEGTVSVTDPTLVMPGNPELGDEWLEESVPGIVEESARVMRVGRRTRVPAGRFRDTVKLQYSDNVDPGTERKVYSRHMGLIKVRGPGEHSRLLASTLGSR